MARVDRRGVHLAGELRRAVARQRAGLVGLDVGRVASSRRTRSRTTGRRSPRRPRGRGRRRCGRRRRSPAWPRPARPRRRRRSVNARAVHHGLGRSRVHRARRRLRASVMSTSDRGEPLDLVVGEPWRLAGSPGRACRPRRKRAPSPRRNSTATGGAGAPSLALTPGARGRSAPDSRRGGGLARPVGDPRRRRLRSPWPPAAARRRSSGSSDRPTCAAGGSPARCSPTRPRWARRRLLGARDHQAAERPLRGRLQRPPREPEAVVLPGDRHRRRARRARGATSGRPLRCSQVRVDRPVR